jgi:hypothetical protein
MFFAVQNEFQGNRESDCPEITVPKVGTKGCSVCSAGFAGNANLLIGV